MRRVVFAVVVLVAFAAWGQEAQPQSSPARSAPTVNDTSKLLVLLAGVQAGGNWNPGAKTPAGFQAGAKLGFANGVLDIGGERTFSKSAVYVEGSALLPLVRFPFRSRTEDEHYVRFYVSPGVGSRIGDGSFGGYTSLKITAMLASHKILTGDTWQGSPYVEFQRRFPFHDPLRGDNRISIGYLLAFANRD